jgi:hypothetical protein
MFLSASGNAISSATRFDALPARALDVDGRLAAAVHDEIDYGAVIQPCAWPRRAVRALA